MKLKLGIVGWPLGYSLSPLMHDTALRAAKLDGKYEECRIEPNSRGESVHGLADISDLEEGIRSWRNKGKLLDGFNVTMPFKSKAYVWVQMNHGRIENHQGSVIAHAVHVINTVKMEGETPVGYITDGVGFLLPLKDTDLAGASVVLLGAGGASRTIAATLALEAGVGKITFFNRSLDNAENTKRILEKALHSNCSVTLEASGDLHSLPVEGCKLLVNATPMGQLGKDDVPLELLDRLRRGQIVYDTVYQPRETRLIEEAKRRGCQVITGDKMLAGQAAESFKIWTGVDGMLIVMQKALDEHHSKSAS